MRRSIFIAVAVVLGLIAGPPVAQATSADIVISGLAYSPSIFKADVSDTIIWDNQDGPTHTATSDIKGFYNTGDIGGSLVYEAALVAGAIPFHCKYHASMEGTLKVRTGLGSSNLLLGNSTSVIAGDFAASGQFTYDIQKKYGDGKWQPWRTGISDPQPQFTPGKVGVFRFRSRVHNANGRASGWSPPVKLVVTVP